ncbi:MAG: radical SAM protein [Elusimicrobia bacterium]|nr:radical SAM protein [Elusimicrobiota bacterium]
MNITLAIAPGFVRKKPLLGVAYLAAALRGRGHAVEVADLNIESALPDEDEGARWWDKDYVDNYLDANPGFLDSLCRRLAATKPDVLGFSAWHLNQPFTMALARHMRENYGPLFILMGGPDADSFFMCRHADAYVTGEGEHALIKIAELLPDKAALAAIPGVSMRLDGRLLKGGEALELPDLDALPLPDFSGFPLESYKHKKTLPISFNRGCRNCCAFCCMSSVWKKFRTRRPDAIYAEFVRDAEVYGADNLQVDCAAFNLDMQAVEGLCDRLIAWGREVRWSGMGLIRPDLEERMADKLAKAGCSRIDFGFESGSDHVLALMRKPFNAAMAEKVVRACAGAGIEVVLSIILGFPGENDEDVENTKRFLERNKRYITDLGVPNECGVGGGSPIDREPLRFGIRPESVTSCLGWETVDGSLTHVTRQKRVEEFCQWRLNAGFGEQKEKSIKLIGENYSRE